MVEQSDVSGYDQDENRDNGIDRATFGELRNRCDYVSEPWLVDADIYYEKRVPTALGERSMTAQEVRVAGVYRLAGGFVVTDADLEADAARFEVGESTGEWAVLRELPSL